MSSAAVPRSDAWKWWICGLLLLATTINYMDRQTLSNAAPRIRAEFDLKNWQYGAVEMAFGLCFALGATLFGILADRTSVRWLYPAVLCAWSLMGFLTGWVEGLVGLVVCRAFLGLFEAGHWPCALKTTQRLLPPRQRTMGNSILQSGAAIGAIITPLIMAAMLTAEPGSWRLPFQAIGLVGMAWAVLWLFSVHEGEVSGPMPGESKSGDYRAVGTSGSIKPVVISVREPTYLEAVFSRRFLALLVLVVGINLTWQIIRAWLPMFLQKGRGYEEAESLYLNSAYNVATDVGCLSAGFATLWLARLGLSIHFSRCAVFFVCAVLTALCTVAAFLPKGWPLVCVLMLIAAGSLGLFPCYYSFSQELSVKHQGKISGLLGSFAWVNSAVMQLLFGLLGDMKEDSYDLGLALVGWAPLASFLVFMLIWERRPEGAASKA